MAAEFGEPLSKRERDVLNELATGLSNKEIATALSISPNTVKVHVRNIFTKLGAASRTEVVTLAMQQGMLPSVTSELADPTVIEVAPAAAVVAAEPIVAPTIELFPDAAPAPIAAPDIETDTPPQRRWLLPVAAALVLLGLIVAGVLAYPRVAAMISPTPEIFIEEELGEVGWLSARPLENATAHHALTSIGVDLYLVGGETSGGVVGETQRYDSAERTWHKLADKPTPVADAAIGVIQGQIYVIGGRLADGSPTNAVELYSPTSDAWIPVAALPVAASGGLALVSDDLLYVFGGQSDTETLHDAFVFDPATNGWRPLPPMQHARSMAVGGTFTNQLLVVGGTDAGEELASCETYDLIEGIWDSCADMLIGRGGASASALFNKLYVMGGGLSDTVTYGEVYDLGRDEWQVLNMPLLNSAESYTHFGTTTVERRIFIVGGKRNDALQSESYIYNPFPIQFFVPAVTNE